MPCAIGGAGVRTNCTRFTKPPDLMLLRASRASSLRGRETPELDMASAAWQGYVKLYTMTVRYCKRGDPQRAFIRFLYC
jgi:hypothetical protein